MNLQSFLVPCFLRLYLWAAYFSVAYSTSELAAATPTVPTLPTLSPSTSISRPTSSPRTPNPKLAAGLMVNISGIKMWQPVVQFRRNFSKWKGELTWDSTKPDGTPRKIVDYSKIKSYTLKWHLKNVNH